MLLEEEMLKAKQLLCTRVTEERTKDGTSSIPTRYQKKISDLNQTDHSTSSQDSHHIESLMLLEPQQ